MGGATEVRRFFRLLLRPAGLPCTYGRQQLGPCSVEGGGGASCTGNLAIGGPNSLAPSPPCGEVMLTRATPGGSLTTVVRATPVNISSAANFPPLAATSTVGDLRQVPVHTVDAFWDAVGPVPVLPVASGAPSSSRPPGLGCPGPSRPPSHRRSSRLAAKRMTRLKPAVLRAQDLLCRKLMLARIAARAPCSSSVHTSSPPALPAPSAASPAPCPATDLPGPSLRPCTSMPGGDQTEATSVQRDPLEPLSPRAISNIHAVCRITLGGESSVMRLRTSGSSAPGGVGRRP